MREWAEGLYSDDVVLVNVRRDDLADLGGAWVGVAIPSGEFELDHFGGSQPTADMYQVTWTCPLLFGSGYGQPSGQAAFDAAMTLARPVLAAVARGQGPAVHGSRFAVLTELAPDEEWGDLESAVNQTVLRLEFVISATGFAT